ncbi:MAG TPA: Hsp20/alpha crystallin family protein [bacterium]|nr:Hsp20/alpha crystallin family protein [bacterium]HPL95467.1 Hsp20/alpha crystallin family protein [bacterium]
MSLIKWTPLSIDPLFDDMDRFLDWPTHRHAFVPAVDVWQDKDNVYVSCPLAGYDPKNINVAVENDVLTIEGREESKSEVDEKNYYRKEVRFGSFHRAVALPAAVDNDKVEAEFENGVLKVTLAKEERVKPKSVEVKIRK